MYIFALYLDDGAIDGVIEVAKEEHAYSQEGNVIECGVGVGCSTHFVDLSESTPAVREKSALGVSHSIEGLELTLTGLPVGARVEVEDKTLVSDKDDSTIEFDTPGTYEIHIYPPPQYRDEMLEVTVG